MENYHRLCEASVYDGYRFRGLARSTIQGGRMKLDGFETVGTPSRGHYVPRWAAANGRS